MGNKNRKVGGKGTKPAKCAFQIAIENTLDVKNGFRLGLTAIKKSDRNKVEAKESIKLQGSLDIDGQVKNIYPQDPRWDYVLSYDGKLYFFEVHPAETSEVDAVINKVKWLKNWLRAKAPEIKKLPKAEHPYMWVQSGRYAILPTAKVQRRLTVSGIVTANKLVLK
ncbi:hypothetical protein [Prevotella multiformis]|uniref:hypothetical protein n=1 Tax=Prevotella multiformis TaxID=282402 RepID=UPI0028DB4EF4|nr:hypothetical protein [Prevotella multiformis]